MGARRALLIGATQAVVYAPHASEQTSLLRFASAEAGRKRFRRYLADSRGAPFLALVDVADEEYRLDTMPRMPRRDRDALLQRKAARLFKDTGYCFYGVTGREPGGQGNDRVALSALANPALLRQWLALLEEASAPLAGICSLPLFTARLLGGIANPATGCHLLLSVQRSSGLRQTCFNNGQFQFSRLAPASSVDPGSLSQLIRAEVEKVNRYLSGQRAYVPGEPLQVHLLFAGALLQALKPAFTAQESVNYHLYDLQERVDGDLARRLVPEECSELYFMQQLLRLKPRNHYATVAERRYFSMQRLRAAGLAASMVLLLGSAGWSARNVLEGLALKRASRAAEAQTHNYAAQYAQARERLPATPVAAPDLKAAALIAQRLAQYKSSPDAMLYALSHSLDEFPSIQLHTLAWTVTAEPNAGYAEASADQTGLWAVTDASGAARALYQSTLLGGRIEPFNGNFREAMQVVQRFADALRGQPAVRDVSIVDLPLNVSADTDLHGNTQARQRKAEFALKLVLENSVET